MKGKYRVVFSTNRCIYDFEVKRKYTVLSGNSATGKSEFVDGVYKYFDNLKKEKFLKNKLIKKESFSNYSCKLDTVVFTLHMYMENGFSLISKGNLLVLIDEGVIDAMLSRQELNKLNEFDNYYVIVSRNFLKMSCLPFSVDEIYEIKTTDRRYPVSDKSLFKSTLSPIYFHEREFVKPNIIVTEDRKSGYQFFSHVLKGYKCISADGNSNIESVVRKEVQKNKNIVIYVIVDGAAFGPYVKSVLDFIEVNNLSVYLYTPESFEWLLLKALFYKGKIKEYIDKPYLYADTKDYISWERYYTYLLRKVSYGTYMEYTKSKLNDFYLQEKNVSQVMSLIPDVFK